MTRSNITNTPARTSVTAVEPAREMGRRRRADADHGAWQSGRAQRLGARDRGGAFLLGGLLQRRHAAAGIGFAGMRHDAAQLGAALMQRAADLDQQRVARTDPGAMAVAIDLDQHGNAVVRPARHRGDGGGLLEAVEHHRQVHALPPQRRDAIELLRRDADGIEDVLDACRGKQLGLLQGRDRRRAAWAVHHGAGRRN
ncbi:hypothetical protein ACVIF9_002879 [Bradyrhizobium sp. USDA 4350]